VPGRIDRHLGDLKLIRTGTEQAAAADNLVLDGREEDPAAGSQNARLRIGQSLLVFRLQAEVERNPFFVEFAKRGLIAGFEFPDRDRVIGGARPVDGSTLQFSLIGNSDEVGLQRSGASGA